MTLYSTIPGWGNILHPVMRVRICCSQKSRGGYLCRDGNWNSGRIRDAQGLRDCIAEEGNHVPGDMDFAKVFMWFFADASLFPFISWLARPLSPLSSPPLYPPHP